MTWNGRSSPRLSAAWSALPADVILQAPHQSRKASRLGACCALRYHASLPNLSRLRRFCELPEDWKYFDPFSMLLVSFKVAKRTENLREQAECLIGPGERNRSFERLSSGGNFMKVSASPNQNVRRKCYCGSTASMTA